MELGMSDLDLGGVMRAPPRRQNRSAAACDIAEKENVRQWLQLKDSFTHIPVANVVNFVAIIIALRS